MTIITIRGQLGSGAREIGRRLARTLEMSYADHEITTRVAAELGEDRETVVAKEMPAASFSGYIMEALERSYALWVGGPAVYLPAWELPLSDNRYLSALDRVVRDLARGPAVIFGRGSQFILKDYPDAFHVLVVAPLDVRLRRVMRNFRLDPDSAKKEIEEYDGSRREFARRYFKAEREDPAHYNLVINTGRTTIEAGVSLIAGTLARKRTQTVFDNGFAEQA